MAKRFAKKESKRLTCRKRYKIEKKVREHNRKVRKSEKNKSKRRPKKDPGVPNECPFKETILKEAEVKKARVEEEKQRKKEQRKKERDRMLTKKRNLASLVSDAKKRTQDFDRKNQFVTEKSKEYGGPKSVELSLKAYYKEFRKVVEASDVVIQVLDARDPLGSRCPEVEESVMSAGSDKRLVLLLNKIDLVPKENVEAWLKYLRNEFPTMPFKASTQMQSDRLSQSKVPLEMASDDLRKSSCCLGADFLMRLLGNYCRHQDIRASITVGIVGFPNTGKSSVINSLKRSKACNVGATPGVTKSLQSVQLDKHVKLVDSPGIVMATSLSDESRILRNCVKIETLEDPVPAVSAILKRCSRQQMMMQYNIGDFSNVESFLSLLAKKMGKLKKGGIPDVKKSGKKVLQDWNMGKIRYYTHPPETQNMATHIDASLVTQMSQEFDIDALLQEEQDQMLKGLSSASGEDIVIDTEGPTQGLVEDTVEEVDMEDKENDEDDEWEDEEMEESEDIEPEVKNVKVAKAIKGKQSKTKEEKKPKTSAESGLQGNQQLNKARKNDMRKLKKGRKRSEKISGQLSDAMELAMDGLGTSDNADDQYNFGVDY